VEADKPWICRVYVYVRGRKNINLRARVKTELFDLLTWQLDEFVGSRSGGVVARGNRSQGVLRCGFL
jgi:hypothetical protein